MAWNGSGTFLRLYNWITDRDASVAVSASKMDGEMDGMATGITACINRDGENAPSAALPMGGFNHTGVGLSTARTHYARTDQVQDSLFTHATESGAADAYVLSLSPAITAYAAGQAFSFFATNTNTGASTLNVTGVAIDAIVTWDGSALAAGRIVSGQLVNVVHDGTNFIILTGYRETFGTSAALDSVDEDTMVSASASLLPTQLSVKNYGRANPIRENSTTEALSTAIHGQITEAALTSSITKTLPAISGTPDGGQYGFRIKSTSGAYTLSIVPNGSDNIDVGSVAGHDLFVMADVGDFVMFVADVSDGAWKIVVDKCAGPHFDATYSGDGQSISLSTDTKLQFNTENSDIWGYYDAATNYRFTPLIPGRYLIELACYFNPANAAASRILAKVVLNGSTDYVIQRTGNITTDFVMSGVMELDFNGSTDYIEAFGNKLDGTGGMTFDDPTGLAPRFKARRMK